MPGAWHGRFALLWATGGQHLPRKSRRTPGILPAQGSIVGGEFAHDVEVEWLDAESGWRAEPGHVGRLFALEDLEGDLSALELV